MIIEICGTNKEENIVEKAPRRTVTDQIKELGNKRV